MRRAGKAQPVASFEAAVSPFGLAKCDRLGQPEGRYSGKLETRRETRNETPDRRYNNLSALVSLRCMPLYVWLPSGEF